MVLSILMLTIGMLLLQILPYLPPVYLLILLSAGVVWVCFRYRHPVPLMLSLLLIGFLYAAWCATLIHHHALPKNQENQPILIHGEIVSLPIKDQDGTHFLFQSTIGRFKLVWKKPSFQLEAGDEWWLTVKLKRIHTIKNIGSVDYEKFAFYQKINAHGVVIPSANHYFLRTHVAKYPLLHIRSWYQRKIDEDPHFHHKPWLKALIIGDHANATEKEWNILRRTGTNHLMAVAGLHIGMIAGGTYWITTQLVRIVPSILLIVPKQLLGRGIAVLAALCYSALTAFSLPTERAFIMLVCLTLASWLKAPISIGYAYLMALCVVLMMNPLVPLSDSFWLSFLTIATIIYTMCGRYRPSGWWWHLFRIQWVLQIGMIPISILFFNEYTFVSFLVNTITIPWLGLFILPFCLIGATFLGAFPVLGKACLLFADKNIGLLWRMLDAFSKIPCMHFEVNFHTPFVATTCIVGIVLLLLPSGIPARWMSILFLLPIFYYTPDQSKHTGDITLTLFDVGQGLSVLVETKQHILLFDTGPNLRGFNAGSDVILPFFQQKQIDHLNMLVVSHGDNDHIGGAERILEKIPVLEIRTSVPQKFQISLANPCLAPFSWQWDGVFFQFLHPVTLNHARTNDLSCVLAVSNRHHRILLTGDIEKASEESLLQYYPQSLPADILIAPHHGSKTSGVFDFVAAVHPRYVLYATGYQNRYHLPSPAVTTLYQQFHATPFNTATSGMIVFRLAENQPIQAPWQYRIQHHRYWFDG